MGEIESGRGLNPELGLKRPGDTRWGSYFSSVMSMIVTFRSVIKVMHTILRKLLIGLKQKELWMLSKH
jgi:hypothetical protein